MAFLDHSMHPASHLSLYLSLYEMVEYNNILADIALIAIPCSAF